MVGPLTLSLETGSESVVTHALFYKTEFGEARIADHQIAGNQGHFHAGLPVFVLLLRCPAGGLRVAVRPLFTVVLDPGKGLFILLRVVNPAIQPPFYLSHVHVLIAHAEIVAKKAVIDHRAGDSHGDTADGKIGFSAHDRRGQSGLCKEQDFVCCVVRNGGIVGILDFATVNGKGRQTFLIVSRQGCGQIDCARPLGTVEAPYGFGA